jgi:excisionase family DNA binding protein
MKVTINEFGDLLTPSEAMQLLGVGRNKIYDLLRSGQIKHFRIGRGIKIPKKCIQEYIDSMVSIHEQHCMDAGKENV